jgi:putative selenium metabolism hydrolase
MKETIDAKAAFHQKDLVQFLRELIAIPSMSGKEERVIRRIQKEMETLGYDELRIDGMGNCIGRIGHGRHILAIDGHCDTVGAGNPDQWETDPFQAVLRNGVIYGRGAADQKGGLASAIYTGAILKELGIPEDVSLLVVASVLEEDFEGLCWKYLIEEDGIRPEAVLLTEPSDLTVAIGQRGRMEMKIMVDGVSCHGSAPELGENAIYKTVPIIQEIEKFNHRLTSDSTLGKGSITVTDIRSSAPSLCAVADRSILHLDRRLTESETIETAVEEIRNLESVQSARAEVTVPEYNAVSYTGLKIPMKACYPMWLMEKDHLLVQTAVRSFESQFERKATLVTWIFSTNGVATKGLYDIPTIGFGPGKETYAHSPIDQVQVKDVVMAAAFYTAFVQHWCSSFI